MDDNKQQIIHYFIEEAQEHLDVVEQGLLDLGEVIKDADRVNEMFRAAHSVKGGAAMLGFDSIQKISHQLEDCFKVLRDHSVDRQLESMFLKGYDALKGLVNELANSPTLTLRAEVVDPIVQSSAGNFVELKEYLNDLLSMGTMAPEETPAAAFRINTNVAVVNQATAVVAPPVNVAARVMENLKAMLGDFKQGETAAPRQKIANYCQNLVAIDQSNANWQNILKIAGLAINNNANSYEALAPVVIKELKVAGDFLAAGRGTEIAPSPAMQEMALRASVTIPESTEQASVNVSAPVAPAAPQQIAIPIDSRAAAQVILRNFNRQQVTELVVLLHRAINAPKQN
jgi:chemotaxis protein histidine kinase CheA